jgi:hypothetical protein
VDNNAAPVDANSFFVRLLFNIGKLSAYRIASPAQNPTPSNPVE